MFDTEIAVAATVPPVPVPCAAPVLAVSAPVATLPEVVLSSEIEPALPPLPLVALPAPPLAVISPVVMPLTVSMSISAPLPPAWSVPTPAVPLAAIVSPAPLKLAPELIVIVPA